MRTDLLNKLKAALDGLYAVIAELIPTDPQKFAVVSYFYPSHAEEWAAVCAKAQLCILNPSSGTGTAADPNYVAQLARNLAAGVTTVGYVTSNYRDAFGPQGDGVDRMTTVAVKAEIDRLYAQYPGLAGIFIDEMNVGGNSADIAYYKDLFTHIKARGGLVILNPGSRFPESYMPLADIFMSAETTPAVYRARVANAFESKYPASRFWHCVHDVTEAEMPEMVALSKARNVGWFYACGPAYSALPSYFTALAAKVKS